MRAALVFAIGLLVACGSSRDAPATSAAFAIVISDEPVVIQEVTTTLVQVVVVGAGGAPVEITSSGLPAFATLFGAVLTLSPALGDAGYYELTLTATAGANQDSATVRLQVTRNTRLNTAPMWNPVPMVMDANRTCCPTPDPIVGTPYLMVLLCDPEGDAITLDTEVAPAGGFFTGTATHTFRVVPTRVRDDLYCAEVFSPLMGLAAPGTYDFHLRVTDALGAVDPYGWVKFNSFSIAP